MTVRERLQKVMKVRDVKKTRVAQILGVHPLSAAHSINKAQKISVKVIMAIWELNPDLNLNWVLTGKGEMFLSEEKMILQEEQEKYKKKGGQSLDDEILMLKKRLEIVENALKELNKKK